MRSTGPSSVSTMPPGDALPAGPIAARTVAVRKSLHDVLHKVDDQRVMMPVQLDDGRLADAVGTIGCQAPANACNR